VTENLPNFYVLWEIRKTAMRHIEKKSQAQNSAVAGKLKIKVLGVSE